METTASVDTPKDFGTDEAAIVSRWRAELELYHKEVKKWQERGRKIVKRYRDERDAKDKDDRRFNILWSNVQVLGPALYARTPKPEVERRFKDRDPIGRLASVILERSVSFSMDDYDFDKTMDAALLDYLLVARGIAWVRYEKGDGEALTENDQPVRGPDGRPLYDVAYEKALCDYVYWEDFAHKPARSWADVERDGWVGRKSYLTKGQLTKRFGEEIAKVVPLDWHPDAMGEETLQKHGDVFKRAVVWEIWNKPDRKVYFIAPSYGDKPLEVRDDPLNLSRFFPCPCPMFGTLTNDTIIPVPDYVEYQDQAMELDELTGRIALLTKALKVAGVYDTSAEGVTRLLSEDMENVLVPVDNWAAFATKGGLEGVISWLPVKEVGEILIGLYEARDRVKQDLYEITGIADIIRGQTDPDETLGAQRIKGQFASLRLSDRQGEVARFARDLIRLKAEIMAEHFSPETLAQMSGYEQMALQDPQGFMQAVQLLKNDRLRSFRIDIETDSTIALDEQADKEAAVELTTALGGFLEKALPIAQAAPELLPVLSETLMFTFRRFKAGRQLESVMEQAMEALGQRASQPQPNPEAEAQKAELEMKREEMAMDAQAKGQELQMKQAESHANLQLKQAETAANIQLKREEMAADHELEAFKAQNQAALETQKAQTEIALSSAKLQGDQALKAREIEGRNQREQND